jgi:hypothetical protein
MQDDIRAEAAQYYDVNPTIPDDLLIAAGFHRQTPQCWN